MFAEVDQPGIGRYLVPGSPFAFSSEARATPAPAPLLGQHTEEILADVARLPEGEIASLFDDGVVSQARRPDRLAS